MDGTLDTPLRDASLYPFDNECRGAMPFQLDVSFRPDERNEFFVKLGFAERNGLNTVSPWALARRHGWHVEGHVPVPGFRHSVAE